MKKILKNRLFTFILEIMLFGSIGVYAGATIHAKDVTYKNTTVDKVLDNLYTTATTTITELKTTNENLEKEK